MANWKSWIRVLSQLLLAGTAVWMSFQAEIIPLGPIGLILLALGAAGWLVSARTHHLFWRWAVLMAWGLSLFVPASLLVPLDGNATPELRLGRHLAVLSWSLAATLLPANCAAVGRSDAAKWQIPAFVWAGFAAVLWLGTTYLTNLRAAFFAATLAMIALLVLIELTYSLPAWGGHATNTLILLLLGLHLVDLSVRAPKTLDTALAPEERLYSFEVARRDPAAFVRWWEAFMARLETMGRDLYMKDRTHRVRFRLRPNAETKLFQSTIRINSHGFRGPELTEPKGNVYRIVCLGESTTFGCTLNAADQPWPRLLEDKIRSRLNTHRPVEVINAGVPSFTLRDNLARLESDILPLNPDMLISYHGFNGFELLHDSFPSTSVSAPPAYRDRPLRLLALVEYRARIVLFRRQLTARLESHPPAVSNLLETAYGRAYQSLIAFARTNEIRLALATHAMAVDGASDPAVIEFYRVVFPTVHWLIAANRLHSDLVAALTVRDPEVRLIHAGKDLDGQHHKFIDLVHLTQEGREQLAENVFSAIKETLQSDLRDAPVERP
ncbi:MAG: hypothetical protein AB9869_37770 [Verrucomicrobiia bacterium]